MSQNIVHVVGTGTIGEPLIGLLEDNQEMFGIDEITFMKRTPLIEERGKVNDLIRRGAKLAVREDRRASFEELGHVVSYTEKEAIDRASVVIDCTPAGNQNKEESSGNGGVSLDHGHLVAENITNNLMAGVLRYSDV